MFFASLIAAIRTRLAKRAEYLRLAAEINSLTESDLADIRGDRSEMLHEAHNQVYG